MLPEYPVLTFSGLSAKLEAAVNPQTKESCTVLNYEKLYHLMSRHEVEFHWVKGHAGINYNERCDEMARSEATKYQKLR